MFSIDRDSMSVSAEPCRALTVIFVDHIPDIESNALKGQANSEMLTYS